MLHAHYRDPEKVRSLIRLGDLSGLGPFLAPAPGQAHGFGYGEGPDPAEGVCVAYGRDRGQADTDAEVHSAIRWPQSGQDFQYLFFPNARVWMWREVRLKTSHWQTLSDSTYPNESIKIQGYALGQLGE